MSDVDMLYRCTACNYKFPFLMCGTGDGAYACPSCKAAFRDFSDGFEDDDGNWDYEYLAYTEDPSDDR